MTEPVFTRQQIQRGIEQTCGQFVSGMFPDRRNEILATLARHGITDAELTQIVSTEYAKFRRNIEDACVSRVAERIKELLQLGSEGLTQSEVLARDLENPKALLGSGALPKIPGKLDRGLPEIVRIPSGRYEASIPLRPGRREIGLGGEIFLRIVEEDTGNLIVLDHPSSRVFIRAALPEGAARAISLGRGTRGEQSTITAWQKPFADIAYVRLSSLERFEEAAILVELPFCANGDDCHATLSSVVAFNYADIRRLISSLV